jgi:hypothetical protein
MEEMGNSMGREAVESVREAGSCAPCPNGREGVSERPETWRTREGVAELAAGASESAVAGRAAVDAVEAAPMAGASPPAGRRLPKRRQRPQRPSCRRAMKVERMMV